MTPPEIPLLGLSGTHREVGEQLGLVRCESLRRAVAFEQQPIGRLNLRVGLPPVR